MRPEIYLVASLLASEHHMTQSQVDLFGRNWKTYDKNIPQDINTLPVMSDIRRTEPRPEAMTLNLIVEEIMKDDANTMVTWSNDGSGMSGVGKYVVQSLHINGVKQSLPTTGIFTESRESLADLIKDTLKVSIPNR